MKPKQIPLISTVTIAALALIVITACMTTTGGKKYYQLYLPPDDPPAAPVTDTILMVEKVHVEDIYNDYRVVYRTSPYQLNYYSYHFWIKKPEKVVRDAIADYLSKGKYFKRLITDFTGVTPDALLKARVHIMEEYDRPGGWMARLKMDVEIKDFKSGKRLLFHSFDRQVAMPAKRVGQLPVLISRIMKEELNSVVRQLEEKQDKQ